MYKEKKLERRRRDLMRMKQRSVRIYYFHEPERAAKWANNIKMCSCHMCGNPRRWYKDLTLKELESIRSLYEQLNDQSF